MKNNCLVLLLTAFVGTIAASSDGDQLAVTLARGGVELYAAHQQHQQSLPNEKNYRKTLYWLDKNNPNWFLLADFQKNFDYHIANLVGHIKVLEDKLLQKKNGLRSSAIIRGAIVSALSVLSGYGAYVFRQAGKEIAADTSVSRYIQIMGSQDMTNAYVGFGFLSGLLGLVATQEFHKAYRYVERLVERLERDKRLLAILEREKDAKNNGGNAVSEAAIQLINSLVGVVTSFSQPAVLAPIAVTGNNPVEEVVAV